MNSAYSRDHDRNAGMVRRHRTSRRRAGRAATADQPLNHSDRNALLLLAVAVAFIVATALALK